MHGGLHASFYEGRSFNEGETVLLGLRYWVRILAPSSFGESPGRVEFFDPCVANLSLQLGQGPGQRQALAA